MQQTGESLRRPRPGSARSSAFERRAVHARVRSGSAAPCGGRAGRCGLVDGLAHSAPRRVRSRNEERRHQKPVRVSGGEGGIRTPGPREGSTDFESAPFGRSGTSPWPRIIQAGSTLPEGCASARPALGARVGGCQPQVLSWEAMTWTSQRGSVGGSTPCAFVGGSASGGSRRTSTVSEGVRPRRSRGGRVRPEGGRLHHPAPMRTPTSAGRSRLRWTRR